MFDYFFLFFQYFFPEFLTRPGPDQIPSVAAHWGAKTPPNSYIVLSVTAHWGKNNPTAIYVCIHMQLKVEEDSKTKNGVNMIKWSKKS